MLGNLINLANEQGRLITDMNSLHDFSERVYTKVFNFGKYKAEAIADLTVNSEGAGYLKWLLEQDSIHSHLA